MTLTTIENKETTNAFLRFKTGYYEKRAEIVPIHGGKNGELLMGHRESLKTVNTFHLLGWGESPILAEAMAKQVVAKQTKKETK